MKETWDTFEHLGLAHERVPIMGLPDGGSSEIWFRQIKVPNPFLSVYLAADHSPYVSVLNVLCSFGPPWVEVLSRSLRYG